MGQRLVVTIRKNDKARMKIYYHWSAYTSSTFATLEDLWCNAIKPLKEQGKSTKEILLGVIHYLEGNIDYEYKALLDSSFSNAKRSCHGGIDGGKGSDEWNYITNKFPNETFLPNPDRNYGLVAISPKGMREMDRWAEGTAEINLDNDTMDNSVFLGYNSKSEYIEDSSYENGTEEAEKIYDSLKVYDGDGGTLFHFKADDVGKVYKEWQSMTDSPYAFKDKYGAVYEEIG